MRGAPPAPEKGGRKMEGRRRKKKPLSRLAKTFLSYALIAALALPPQAAWADGQSLSDGNAAGDDSLAVGEGAGAYAEGSIAIGRNAVAETDGEYALAVGYSAKASGKNSVAIGYNSVASEAYTVSVGGNGTTRRIVNVAESTADTDAATVGQLASLGSEVARIVGGQGLTYDGKSFTGAAVNIGGKDYETIEAALNALYAGTAGSTGGAVSGDEIVIDPSKDAVTIARGGNIQITRDAEDDNKFTIGVSPTPTFTEVYTGSVSMSSDGIKLGGKKITGLAEGVTDTDAVNVSQLNSLGSYVQGALSGIGTRLEKLEEGWTFEAVNTASGATGGDGTGSGTGGGSSTILPGDTLSLTAGENVNIEKTGDNSYTISVDAGSMELNDGENITVVNNGTSTTIEGDQVTISKDGGESTTVINYGGISVNNNSAYFYENSMKIGNITYVQNEGLDMGGEKITGLADGNIAQGSTDAVTGNQLWEAYRRMGDMQEAINVVGAHAAALSGLHPIQYNPYEPTTLSAAIGTYRDEYAVAVGVFHYVRSNVLFNLGASICSDGDVMGRAGISFAVGKGGKKKPELARDMVGMQQQMIAMQAMLEELKEENAKNKETIKKNEETIKELKEALGKKK